jgi:hypothetical protein
MQRHRDLKAARQPSMGLLVLFHCFMTRASVYGRRPSLAWQSSLGNTVVSIDIWESHREEGGFFLISDRIMSE